MDIAERISLIIKEKNLSKRAFSRMVNCTDTAINNILNKRNEPGYKTLFGILQTYVDISPDWLLLGKGEMYRTVMGNSNDDIDILTEVITNQKQEISDLKTQIREKDKQLGELIKTNLMLLEREKSTQTHEKGSSGSLAG
jgi:transcriptional regulator with XRE-family HTH domain